MKFLKFKSKDQQTEQQEQKCVLIADDVSTIRMIAGKVFKDAGCRVVEARNGAEALQMAQTFLPDLIILDVNMSVVGGLEVLEQLRDDGRFTTIPIVMLTGNADQETIDAATSKQATDYIVKDNLDNVMAKLEKYIEGVN